MCENCKYACLICQSKSNITASNVFAVCGNVSIMLNNHMFLIDFVSSRQMKQMNSTVCNHFIALTEVKGCSSYIVMVIDRTQGPHSSKFWRSLQCIGLARSSCFPLVLCSVEKANHFMVLFMCSVCPQCCIVPMFEMICCVQKTSSHHFPLNSYFLIKPSLPVSCFLLSFHAFVLLTTQPVP